MKWITPRRRQVNVSAWSRLEIAIPPSLIFVAVDFEQHDLGGKLAAAGFQQNSPAFFTWLGVVPYLTEDAIGRILDYISSIANSEVVFDYVEPPEAFSEELRQIEKARAEQLEKMGERSSTRFRAGRAWRRFFAHTDFVTSEDVDYQQIASRFGSAVQALAPGHAGLHVVHARASY